MAGNLKIRALSNWSLGITAVLAILCIAVSILGFRKYEVLQSSTRDYIACEAAAQRFQTGSDTLTRRVRLAAATGEQTYIDAYFEEANVTRSRETALADLSALHGGEDRLHGPDADGVLRHASGGRGHPRPCRPVAPGAVRCDPVAGGRSPVRFG